MLDLRSRFLLPGSLIQLVLVCGTGPFGCDTTNNLQWQAPAGNTMDASDGQEPPSEDAGNSATTGLVSSAADAGETTSGGAVIQAEGGTAEQTTLPSNDASLPSGETFFLGTCAPCHGATGQGNPGIAPDIAHPVRDYATWVVRNGRESGSMYPAAMMAFDDSVLPDALLVEVWNYLASVPQPTTGETLYNDYCAACHGADASGGPAGVNIQDEADDIQDQVRDGNDPGTFQERDKFMPSWSSNELSDEELELIASYVESL